MTFIVNLAQFDVAPTRNLIISRCKIAKYVTSHLVGGLRNMTICDKRRRGKKIMKFVWRNLWMAPKNTMKTIIKYEKAFTLVSSEAFRNDFHRFQRLELSA